MKITTNNKPRALVSLCELPTKDQADFDYLESDDCTARFVNYKNAWYDTHDTQRIEIDSGTNGRFMGWSQMVSPDSILAHWHAILIESVFSGILFKFTDDFQSVICARYAS